METSEQNNSHKKGDQKIKVGVVPQEQISGSDADKAYDKEGNFSGESSKNGIRDDQSETPAGSDASENQSR